MDLKEAKKIIDKEYKNLRRPGADRSQIYINIIAIKRESGLTEYQNPLYVDLKQWIDFHFEDLSKKDFGYDVFVAEPFCEQIELFPTERAIRLYNYLLAACENNHSESSDISERLHKMQISHWVKKHSWGKIFLYELANNFKWIIGGVIAFLGFVTLCFLPAPFDWMHCLDIHFLDWSYSDGALSLTDYVSNALYYIAHGETDSPMVTPCNPGGVIWIIGVECAFWGFLINFLYQHLIEYLSNLSRQGSNIK